MADSECTIEVTVFGLATVDEIEALARKIAETSHHITAVEWPMKLEKV